MSSVCRIRHPSRGNGENGDFDQTPPPSPAHPHGRGEDAWVGLSDSMESGSPPRAWGGRIAGPGRGSDLRLTPTGMGTRRRAAAAHPGPAHPHGRGEDPHSSSLVTRITGSPPRAWGGQPHPARTVPARRLTPTGVGRTVTAASARLTRTAHPHGRGEDISRPVIESAVIGSPPRAWGGPARARIGPVCGRLTPTGVGRTSRAVASSYRHPAHPHGRGEDLTVDGTTSPTCGSPPRAWGGPGKIREPERTSRLTPTGVGRTPARPTCRPRSAAHPHGRGEDVDWVRQTPRLGGSPPRAWGGRQPDGPDLHIPGLTPTGVGRTPPVPACLGGSPAHPHGRGEDRRGCGAGRCG